MPAYDLSICRPCAMHCIPLADVVPTHLKMSHLCMQGLCLGFSLPACEPACGSFCLCQQLMWFNPRVTLRVAGSAGIADRTSRQQCCQHSMPTCMTGASHALEACYGRHTNACWWNPSTYLIASKAGNTTARCLQCVATSPQACCCHQQNACDHSWGST